MSDDDRDVVARLAAKVEPQPDPFSDGFNAGVMTALKRLAALQTGSSDIKLTVDFSDLEGSIDREITRIMITGASLARSATPNQAQAFVEGARDQGVNRITLALAISAWAQTRTAARANTTLGMAAAHFGLPPAFVEDVLSELRDVTGPTAALTKGGAVLVAMPDGWRPSAQGTPDTAA